MSASQDSVVGDIIEIEHTDDYEASTPTWTLVGKTTDTIEIAPNVEIADSRIHEQFVRDKAASSSAPEVTFSRHIVSPPGTMEALHLQDTTDYEMSFYSDTRQNDTNAEALRITVYDSEADRDADNVKKQWAFPAYILLVDSGEIAIEDFSTWEMVLHCLTEPIDLSAGGSL